MTTGKQPDACPGPPPLDTLLLQEMFTSRRTRNMPLSESFRQHNKEVSRKAHGDSIDQPHLERAASLPMRVLDEGGSRKKTDAVVKFVPRLSRGVSHWVHCIGSQK